MNRIVNLTPHTINILIPKGRKLDIFPSGRIARLSYETESAGVLEYEDAEIEVTRHTNPIIDNLPEPEPDTFYIVPLVVAQAAKRADVLSPARLVRDADGYPIGCTGFMAHV